MKVSIIIPNFNGEGLLRKNLPFLKQAMRYRGNHIIEAIIVDDASTDNSVGFIKNNYPDIRLIKHKVNRGFSSSVNTGARSAKGSLLALLNTDVIPEKDFLVSALPHFKNSRIFAVSFNEESYGWARAIFANGYVIHKPEKKSKITHETFWASGGSALFKRRYWMELNGMDEKLFSPFYWEDTDLCYRAMKRGWINLWEPNAKVKHIHETTIGKLNSGYRKKIQERNQLIFIWKNITSPNMFRKHLTGLLSRVYFHPGYLKIVFITLRQIRIILKFRKKQIRKEKVSDEAIFARFKSMK